MSININQYLILVVLGLFTGMVNAFPNNDNTSLIEVAKQESTSVQSSFEIVNPLIDMCLSPKNKLSKLGTKVTFETCDNNEKQQWTLNKSDKVIK
ncbi:hypothetical protein [Thalassotalea piscium]|uniref:Ricin B lectin domain-containing protein n=1 Tax=Thalassotalea piscium TaxID=1230533 RepID=A0A7X0NKF5_9GAMM|nr:hypothetical protein [Thalassotalea piscium]MBB6544941.1 hypothetical protein [Thalassotalea piscium]